mmetsp:Transcript_11086/g.16868  ORF Transcript_11086/g.16868 Transcript_11086/m.16868 type:complete len:130 (-) Transcript_11086:995-1384(-)
MVCTLRGCVAPNWTMARELMNSMTFKLELMLMDPTQIKPPLIRKVLRILNKYQKQLTPVNLLQVDQGASILLTWIINFVKWHTGYQKYSFSQQTDPAKGILAKMDGSITNNDEFLSHQPGNSVSEDKNT